MPMPPWRGSPRSTTRASRSCARPSRASPTASCRSSRSTPSIRSSASSSAASTLNLDARLAFGALHDPGVYGTTLTRPALFGEYYRHQIALLLQHHGTPVVVGISDRRDAAAVRDRGEHRRHPPRPGERAADRLPAARHEPDRRCDRQRHLPRRSRARPKPLALFTAERVDYSLERLHHYTATAPEHVQRFILLTNYQRYVEHFIDYAERAIREGDELHDLRRARQRDHAQPAADRPGGRRPAARAICRRCPPTI